MIFITPTCVLEQEFCLVHGCWTREILVQKITSTRLYRLFLLYGLEYGALIIKDSQSYLIHGACLQSLFYRNTNIEINS